MLWHRQAILESKSSNPLLNAVFEPRVSNTKLPANWMPADKLTELSRVKAKYLNSTTRPYDQRTFSRLDPTSSWLSHLDLATYMFVAVNYDDLAQARGFRIDRGQIVFLCLMLYSNLGSQAPNPQQTECPLTKQLRYVFSFSACL